MRKLRWLGLGLALTLGSASALAISLDDAIKADHRSDENKARDVYRHPKETLEFFGIRPDMTVVEVWPGAGGWYTEILAPYLRDKGTFYAAQFDPNSGVSYFTTAREDFEKKMAASPAIYDKVKISSFQPPQITEVAPAGTVDMVLTFRNVHNWYMRGGGEEKLLAAFKGFHTALKPGGVLGVVDHRLPAARSANDQEQSGYMLQDYVIKMAEKAGFKLVDQSEINANPKDIANHPKGVWTLPPRLALGEQDKDKYLAIGESDRMTLKFVKE
ncbi:methyltransferase [Aliiglaciecola sp. CAU 1673]|uniref:class I SAM-dependent methyltransferase n=1 Tax=Aliiglaciecola sp. CAU 1673 TaxID=3032595 RepID=UPI0023DCDCD3|nr:methyltransferase [Aliiglaciecola sp. CAU 1673]MDF2178406.1 methyltransferase [Aliiglaciecola sp. CAU 1673]